MISGMQYKLITDKISEIQSVLANSSSVAVDMQASSNRLSLAYIAANPLINFNNTSNEIDYFSDINNTLISMEASGANASSDDLLNTFVRALQDYILDSYESIDKWLAEQNILVKQEFYDISNNLGYSISSTYLE